MFTLYQIKPHFQHCLRPLVVLLANRGVTANSITILATLMSVIVCFILIFFGRVNTILFLILPFWLFIRMALNAIDGMLAREHHQKTLLGRYLNELGDIISDTAMVLPFAWISPFNGYVIGLLIYLILFSEMAGILAYSIGVQRRYDGPMGKSDRALLFGCLGTWVAFGTYLPNSFIYVLILVCGLLVMSAGIRTRNAINSVQ